jgi:serine O-acetyltransferase
MKKYFIAFRIMLEFIRCSVHLALYFFHPNKAIIRADTKRWIEILRLKYSTIIGFIYLLSFFPEFRSLFYKRVSNYRFLLNIYCHGKSSLIIDTKLIGEGLFIQHGFATAIGAKSIGKNCFINQQVTIGYANENDCPTILDNVQINAGAVIIGNVTIGNNVVVGANATVFTDIPDNCTVLPASSRIMHWNAPQKNN